MKEITLSITISGLNQDELSRILSFIRGEAKVQKVSVQMPDPGNNDSSKRKKRKPMQSRKKLATPSGVQNSTEEFSWRR